MEIEIADSSGSDKAGLLAGMIAERGRASRLDASALLSTAHSLAIQGALYLEVEGIRLVTSSSPKSYLRIADLGRPGLQLVEPFDVEQEFSDGFVVLSHAPTELFGYGRTLEEAMSDFQEGAAELFERLSANEARLGPGLVPIFRELNRRIRRA
jgi:hypothetical protein